MATPAEPDPADAAEGTFISHLVELRNRLLYSVIAVGALFAALVPFSNFVYELLANPLLAVLPAGTTMIATEVASPFLTPLKLTVMAAVVLAVPYILYQLWAFVAPGLYRNEKRLVVPLLLSSTLLFYVGMTFAYFIVFPAVFSFFVVSAPKGVTVMTDIRAYLDFAFTIFFAFGFAFEVPVAVVLLAKMGIVDPKSLRQKRPYVVLGIFIIAAFLTPPDIFSQTFLAIPMWMLFEVGLVVASRMAPEPHADDEDTSPNHSVVAPAGPAGNFGKSNKRSAGRKKKKKN
jgi:sec-independent protein translocase protein TatC